MKSYRKLIYVLPCNVTGYVFSENVATLNDFDLRKINTFLSRNFLYHSNATFVINVLP